MVRVVSVSASGEHTFSKPTRDTITLIAGFGVEGDAHAGSEVKHRYLVRRDPSQPNLRQVHLIQEELFAALAEQGHVVSSGELGENITTAGVDLLALPTGAILRIGPDAAIELTGLRNPCSQIDEFQEGLMSRLRYRNDDGRVVRIAGVMGVVLAGGIVRPGDAIQVEFPAGEHRSLEYITDSHSPIRTPGTPRNQN